jgi:hypothetical protein
MTDAFSGIRVLDFTSTIAGPHCARLLADLGADVIKIEPPDGDMMRARLPLRNGASTSFGQLNAGKRCIVLDLKRPEAVAAAKGLARDADVVVENFRPGVMARLGLDYHTLAALNPRLIYCAISGYGQTGPSAARPAYAPVIHAASGFDLGHLAYQSGRTRPDNCGIYVCDVLAGTYAFGAIAAALHQRHATGCGQFIDLSLLESTMSLMLSEIQAAQFPVAPPARPIYGPIETADGFVMLAMGSERIFQNLAAATGRADWLSDPRFAAFAAAPIGANSSTNWRRGRGRAPRPTALRCSMPPASRPHPIAACARRWPTRSSPIAAPLPRCRMAAARSGRSTHRSACRGPRPVSAAARERWASTPKRSCARRFPRPAPKVRDRACPSGRRRRNRRWRRD